VRDATNKSRHGCARRRVGEAAGSYRDLASGGGPRSGGRALFEAGFAPRAEASKLRRPAEATLSAVEPERLSRTGSATPPCTFRLAGSGRVASGGAEATALLHPARPFIQSAGLRWDSAARPCWRDTDRGWMSVQHPPKAV